MGTPPDRAPHATATSPSYVRYIPCNGSSPQVQTSALCWRRSLSAPTPGLGTARGMADLTMPLGSIRNLPNLLDEPDRMPEVPTVPVLVALLRSTDENERDEALATMAEMVDGAFGEDGAQLGQEMRANGGVALLSWLLADPSPEVQQMSLMILGNLCSDSVDASSNLTKQALLCSGGARAILSCVHTEDPAVLLFACGALQNLCFQPDW